MLSRGAFTLIFILTDSQSAIWQQEYWMWIWRMFVRVVTSTEGVIVERFVSWILVSGPNLFIPSSRCDTCVPPAVFLGRVHLGWEWVRPPSYRIVKMLPWMNDATVNTCWTSARIALGLDVRCKWFAIAGSWKTFDSACGCPAVWCWETCRLCFTYWFVDLFSYLLDFRVFVFLQLHDKLAGDELCILRYVCLFSV